MLNIYIYIIKIVIPFLLLKNKEFPLSKCYAYFNTFMNQYFPKVLEQRVCFFYICNFRKLNKVVD